MMNRLITGVIAAFYLGIASISLAAEHTKDTLAEVKKAVEDGKAVLIDVREESEWKEGHLKDAKLLPLSKLKSGVTQEELKKLLPEGKIIYLHCGSGVRSLKAADLLKSAGFDTRPMKPGYEELLKSGFPKAQ